MDKEFYKGEIVTLLSEVAELKDYIKELETKLYFCHRNNKIEKEVNDR